jgi:hypothetical protein
MSKNDKYTLDLDLDRWHLKCEGKPVSIGNVIHPVPAGFALRPLYWSFIDETVAEDVCFLLNQAFKLRMAEDQAEREQDRKECQTHSWVPETVLGGEEICENCGARRE